MDIVELKENEMRGKKPEINIPDNFVIAGGAVRRWFTGKKNNSDIDLFRTDGEEDYEIQLNGWNRGFETLMAINYFNGDGHLQVIKRPYESVDELFESFDFHHCQFAYDGEGHIFTTKKGIISSLRKHLSFNNVQEGFELDTLRRAFKYQRQGYTPCAGTIGELAKNIRESDSDFDKQMKMSPSGGKKDIVHFD